MTGHRHPGSADLDGWLVFTLRPAGQAQGLSRRLRAHAARAINLPLLRLRPAGSGPALTTLTRGSADTRWLFTSPAAVRFTAALAPAALAPDGAVARSARADRVFAPGRGTAQALADHGITPVAIPETRFDSEGLLALPALAPPLQGELLLIGAPGGRDLLREQLSQRGLRVTPVTVYQRVPARVPARHWLIDASRYAHLAVILSSAAMLERLREAAPATALGHLHAHALLVVSSDRLAELAHAQGFRRCVRAASPSDRDLVDAVRAHRDRDHTRATTDQTD